MTALEQQLTKALRALSAQYEQAQQQHAEQVETLRRQVEALRRQVAQLNGQVTRVARVEHSQAKLEGLLEGLREAITVRATGS